MINNVTLVGRLTAAPDLRKTPSNVSALQGTLAVNRNFKNQNGEREADFINFQAWRGTADIIAEYCGKGSLIGITGRIQTRNYENQQGQRVYVTEVVADSVALLESRNSQGSQQNQGNSFQNGNSSQGGNVNNGYNQQTPNFARDSSPYGNTNPFDISDDDLPF
ncbi:single-stranded DNA-binding protein [Streptococcus vestibularis]|uniref:Single-stranded DNA-binding protein n=1 Tax=Streptococcus vestibularis TaxID=1343 RepID=A0A564TS00_STRVE|nr:single-stranded DNA-binding protein [Streptococcus vestibularis]VUX09990.1 Single-stranded DNA-binding protein ssb [Streptococcus vestibularis]